MNVEEYKKQAETALAKVSRLQHLTSQAGWRDLEEEYERWENKITDIKKSNTKEDFLAAKKAVIKMQQFWNSIATIIESGKSIREELNNIENQQKKTEKILQEKLK